MEARCFVAHVCGSPELTDLRTDNVVTSLRPAGRDTGTNPLEVPVQRRRPLDRRTALTSSGAPLKRTTLKPTAQPRRPAARRDTGLTPEQDAAVLDRDGNVCAVCGGPPGSIHHRANRQMGGRHGAAAARINNPGNALTLCGSGTTGCHGWITDLTGGVTREHLERLGWVVSAHHPNPADVPVWTRQYGWRLFHEDGTAANLPAPPPPYPHRPDDTRTNPPTQAGAVSAHHIARVAAILTRAHPDTVAYAGETITPIRPDRAQDRGDAAALRVMVTADMDAMAGQLADAGYGRLIRRDEMPGVIADALRLQRLADEVRAGETSPADAYDQDNLTWADAESTADALDAEAALARMMLADGAP